MHHVLTLLIALLLCACGGAAAEPAGSPADEPQIIPDPGDPEAAPLGDEDAEPAEPQPSGSCTQDSDCPAGSRCVEAVPIAAVGASPPKRCVSESGGPPVESEPKPEPQP